MKKKMKRRSGNSIVLTITAIVLILAVVAVAILVSSGYDKQNSGKRDIITPAITETASLMTPTVTPAGPTEIATSLTQIITATPAPLKTSFMKLHFIDVDQGDSILIESDKHYMLIDAGQDEQGSVVVDYLKKQGVKRLDFVIATHPHNDHIGGLDKVINSFTVDNIIMPSVTSASDNYAELMNAVAEHKLKITKAEVGNEYALGEASFVIVSPNSTNYEALNDYSAGIKLSYGSNSFLLTGDAQKTSEAEMLKNGIDLSADVLKLSHHGSSTSSSGGFLEKVQPKYAVISVGADNEYEHPHSDTMQAMVDRGIKVYRTDKQGTIIFTADGKNITVNAEPYKITASDLTSDAAEEEAKAKGY